MAETAAQRRRRKKRDRRPSTNPAHNPEMVLVACDDCGGVQPNRHGADGKTIGCARCGCKTGVYWTHGRPNSAAPS